MKITKLDRKKFRIRNKTKKVSSKERYRLSVNRSIKNISAQIIDDSKNITILSAT
ncbi:50S ribosomal protein L18, partial [Candidatus Pelagibacter sp.]|nr:50S ribosomal protein L18 [Candidatus Pelagibacter sp.]